MKIKYLIKELERFNPEGEVLVVNLDSGNLDKNIEVRQIDCGQEISITSE